MTNAPDTLPPTTRNALGYENVDEHSLARYAPKVQAELDAMVAAGHRIETRVSALDRVEILILDPYSSSTPPPRILPGYTPSGIGRPLLGCATVSFHREYVGDRSITGLGTIEYNLWRQPVTRHGKNRRKTSSESSFVRRLREWSPLPDADQVAAARERNRENRIATRSRVAADRLRGAAGSRHVVMLLDLVIENQLAIPDELKPLVEMYMDVRDDIRE